MVRFSTTLKGTGTTTAGIVVLNAGDAIEVELALDTADQIRKHMAESPSLGVPPL